MRAHVQGGVVAVRPAGLAFLPRRDVLADEVGAEPAGVGEVYEAAEPAGASGVVDGDEAAPLLDGQGCVGGQAEPDLLALGVEGIEVDVGNHAQGCSVRVRGHLCEVFVRVLRPWPECTAAVRVCCL